MKRAFSLVEIGFVILVMMAVVLTVVPFSISNIKQARYISDWKNYMSQVDYAFETLKEYDKNSELNKKESVARLMHYLDAKPVNKDDKLIKKYKYKMLNGKFYQKINISKFDEIYMDVKKRLIGTEYGQDCGKTNPCATIWVDLNGKNLPNTVGNDIFVYEVYSDTVSPYGKGLEFETLQKDCSTYGTGMFCAQFYLLGGDLK